MKRILILLALYFLTSIPAFCIEEVQAKKVYYLSDCIKMALDNSPVIKKAKLNVEVAKKDINLAKSDYSPTIGAGIGYWQGVNSNKAYDDGYTKRFAPTIGVYLDQLIYNFGKTSAYIDLQKFYKIAADYQYADSICETVNDVKLKYFNVLEAKSEVNIEENNIVISKKILDVTKELYEQNKKEEIDYINAQVYYSSAIMNLTNARNNYNQAMADLANALYIAGKPDFEIKYIDTFDYYDAYFTPEFIEVPKGSWHEIKKRERQQDIIGDIQNIPFTLEYAQTYSMQNNIELKVLESTLDAMKKSAVVIKRQYYPSLKGRLGYEHNSKYVQNTDTTDRNDQLNVSVSLNSSVNPFAYSNELAKANYQIQLAENDVELFRQNMFFNVKKYYMDVETAQKQIKVAIDKTYQAKQNLEIAGKGYRNGEINYIELQLARRNYNSAKLDYIKELKNYNISLSKLEQITHIHKDDYHSNLIQN